MNYLGSISVHVLTKSIWRNNGRKHTSQEQQSYLYLLFVTIPTTKHHKIRFDQDQDKINHITHKSISVTWYPCFMLRYYFLSILLKEPLKICLSSLMLIGIQTKHGLYSVSNKNIIVQCLLICSCSMNISSHIRFW